MALKVKYQSDNPEMETNVSIDDGSSGITYLKKHISGFTYLNDNSLKMSLLSGNKQFKRFGIIIKVRPNYAGAEITYKLLLFDTYKYQNENQGICLFNYSPSDYHNRSFINPFTNELIELSPLPLDSCDIYYEDTTPYICWQLPSANNVLDYKILYCELMDLFTPLSY